MKSEDDLSKHEKVTYNQKNCMGFNHQINTS